MVGLFGIASRIYICDTAVVSDEHTTQSGASFKSEKEKGANWHILLPPSNYVSDLERRSDHLPVAAIADEVLAILVPASSILAI